ncbi:DEAD/DEAH box helicase [Natronospora cellulosivora (SeqCode)]
MKSNFSFLQSKWTSLGDLAKAAEDNLYRDPNTTIVKLRMFAEQIVDYIFAYDNLDLPEEDNLFNKLKLLEREELIQNEIAEIFHSLRIEGNKAVHESYDSLDDAKTLLSLGHKLGVWFMEVYGEWDFDAEDFVLPEEKEDDNDKLELLQEEYEKMINKVQKEIAAIKVEQERISNLAERKELSEKSNDKIKLNEAESKILGFFSGNKENTSQEIESGYKFITTETIDSKDSNSSSTVWDSVRRSFSERDCIAYWKYPIFSKRGEDRKEPDILIADKEYGLIVLEVEDYTIEDIANLSDEQWEYNIDKESDSPIYLAEDQLYAIKGLCESDRSLRRIQGRVAVVLANITKDEWEEKDYPTENIIFADCLGKKTFLKEVLNLEAVFGRGKLANDKWNNLLMVLSGQNTFKKKAEEKSKKDRKTRSGIKAIIKENLFEVDMQQEAIGKTIPPGPQRIRGIAGSGKTVLLSQKAAHMHLKHPDWKIALVFFTRSLYDSTKREVDKWLRRFSNGEIGFDSIENDKLQILHAWGAKDQPGFYTTVCKSHKTRPLTASRKILGDGEPNERLVKACKLFLEKTEEIEPIYDAILIDEAQDLVVDNEELKYQDKQPFYWLAYKSLKPVGEGKEKRLIWAYDEAQSLNSLNIPSAPQLFGQEPQFKRMVSGFHKGGIRKSEIMNKCYRTPGPVLTAAHAIGMGLLREGGMLRGYTTQEDWENIGYEILEGSFNPVGQKVVIHRPDEMTPNRVAEIWDGDIVEFNKYNTRKEEIDNLAKKIRHNIEVDGLKPCRDILVIALGDPKESYRLKVDAAKAIKNEGIDIYIPKALKNNIYYPKYPKIDANKYWNKGGVTISNTYRAKGNEAFMVYVIGLDKIAEDEANFALRNQLFVALTRTKGWLNVSGVGEFPLYDEFKRVLDSGNRFEFIFQRPLLK